MMTSLLLLAAGGCFARTIETGFVFDLLFWAIMVVGCLAVGIIAAGTGAQRIRADIQRDDHGRPRFYTLTHGKETVILEPGKPWHKVDTFKWITRGLIEEPQSLHVLPDGTVDINAERIGIHDPDGIQKLEREINKHHPPSIAHHPPSIISEAFRATEEPSTRVRFKVKLDHLGHLMIECTRGSERIETSMRGLQSLVQGGFMIKPQTVRVDPLQRGVEIDGVRFECTETGAQSLQDILNARYAPELMPEDHNQILVKDNPASATGFDIEFVAVYTGGRLDVKGHLSQERLNLLQDYSRCDLLRRGIVLRLSPPYLLVRRRQPDGGEETLPEIPDVHYLRVTAAELQQVLNHTLVRRFDSVVEALSPMPAAASMSQPPRLSELRLTRNRQSRLFLWLEFRYTQGKPTDGRAFTHHNVAHLQHRGVFQPHLDVSLSIDNRRLGILNQTTHEEQVVSVDYQSSDADLARASELLTAALIPAKPCHT